MPHLTYRIDGPIATITLNNPPATGPTKAHAAHKALLRIWALGGVQATDDALLDISMPLFDNEDTQRAAFGGGQPGEGCAQPILEFDNR
jgi:hypothetical protein